MTAEDRPPRHKCYASQHLQPKEYGLWEVCMRLTSGGKNNLHFDGRAMASRFSNTSKSSIYRTVGALVASGWLRPLNGTGRKVASDTRRYEATEYKVLSHLEWIAEHGIDQCSSPKYGNGVGMEPVPSTGQSIPENEEIPVPSTGHSFVVSSVKDLGGGSFVAESAPAPSPLKPEAQTPNYAKELLTAIGLPTKGNIAVARESIAVEARFAGITEEQAFVLIRKAALYYMRAGEKVDAFWFQDAKWRMSLPYLTAKWEREQGKPLPAGWVKEGSE